MHAGTTMQISVQIYAGKSTTHPSIAAYVAFRDEHKLFHTDGIT